MLSTAGYKETTLPCILGRESEGGKTHGRRKSVFESGEARIQSRQGLVLSTMDYKDNDGLITMADENGIFKVYAKGVQKETSKTAGCFCRFRLPVSLTIRSIPGIFCF
ncbi:recombination protein O N-terminal domain-containing protein [Allobaculum sp. Allo2]|uniref:recombination protein O N-terminal domain-containing protein n=1 Tax=Allobaculum sp. Allo2 TaxID=2853432 RepID=UPI001F603B83|nr:recombination protein O N-terminal domain-containing protein [Allobaculum sp. Allo2]UNT92545.1 recombination protein O N-terminal domain-containing protein [Allobaculum sp. Allo2]